MTELQNKIFSIHQPNYIPWCGYFYKMMKSDIFVYLDIVQFPRGQSFAARNRIKTPNGDTYLTIPKRVPKGRKGKALYTEVEFADSAWTKKHLNTISQSYIRSKYFDEVYKLLESQYLNAKSFIKFNIGLLEAIADYLEINTERICLSELGNEFGNKTNLIIDIAYKLNAGIYLSGDGGGREYNDEKQLNSNNIELRYTNFIHPLYDQLWGDFISHLSIIDLLFNYGKESKNILLNQ